MIARIVAMALGLFGGLVASQGPEFAQQYRQRLGGAIDELSTVLSRFDADAAAVGRSRDEMIGRFAADPDAGIRRQADSLRAVESRHAGLERQRREFREAGPFGRLVVLAREADPGLARAAYLDFEPAVPATQEGVLSAGAGFVIVWAGLLFVGGLLGQVFRRRPRPSRPIRRSA